MFDNSIFDKVLFIGPDIRLPGGIASVLRTYSNMIEPFHHLAVNSRRGKVVGYLSLAFLLAKLPFHRFSGQQIVHVHYASGKSWRRESLIASWARFCGFKTVMHCHSGLFPDYAAEHISEVHKILGRCDINVVLSPKWSKIFETKLKIDGTRPINNVIYPSGVTHIASSQNRPACFTFIGDIIDRKGIFDLIDATDLLDDDNWKLVICGRGDIARLGKRISESPNKDKIEFRGVITSAERDTLLAQTDAIVLPSYFEGVPMVVLEGMSAGTGVIVSDVGAVSDMITDRLNGFIVTPGDREGLVKAMKKYIDNRNLVTEHAAVSAKRIEAYYPDAVRQCLIDLYGDILGGK